MHNKPSWYFIIRALGGHYNALAMLFYDGSAGAFAEPYRHEIHIIYYTYKLFQRVIIMPKRCKSTNGIACDDKFVAKIYIF